MDEEKKEFLSDYSSLDVYFQEAVKAVANVAKSSNGIPSDTKDNWDFYSTFTDFRKVMNVQSDQVRSMIENILLHNGVKVHVPKNSGVTTKVEDILEMLAEANDNLLERIQTIFRKMNNGREDRELRVSRFKWKSTRKKGKVLRIRYLCKLGTNRQLVFRKY